MIERRLPGWAVSASSVPHPLAARMLAGALVESIDWWLDRPGAATPAEMDGAFHRLAMGLIQARQGAAQRS